MKPILKVSRRLLMSFVFVSLAFFLQLLAKDLQLGRQSFVQFDAAHQLMRPDAPFLAESIPMAIAKDSPRFLGGVGGVSFDQVGRPAPSLAVTKLTIQYNPAAEDGKRLELSINGMPVQASIPSWLLVPIAKYADSTNYSCFTLFGKLHDKALEKRILVQKGRVMNYHPAFDNTLLGIRLAYMDMLVCYTFAIDLPKNSEGQYILGTGEVPPDVRANNNGAYYLSQYLVQLEKQHKVKFRSYVITDYPQQITFSVVGDKLSISGFPYYYCWEYMHDHPSYDMNRASAAFSKTCSKKMREVSVASGDMAVDEWLIGELLQVAKKYDGTFNFYTEGTFVDMIKLGSDNERAQFLRRYDRPSLISMLEQTEMQMDADTIIPLKAYSDGLSAKPELFAAANPAVWNATVTTMRFAAFFRYVKASHPQAWASFVDQIQRLDPDPEPRVVTPTVMYDPASTTRDSTVRIGGNRR